MQNVARHKASHSNLLTLLLPLSLPGMQLLCSHKMTKLEIDQKACGA